MITATVDRWYGDALISVLPVYLEIVFRNL